MRINLDQFKHMLDKIKGNAINVSQCEIIKKPSKYSNEAKIIDGIRFASKLEANLYTKLKTLKEAGVISYFLMQVPMHLPGAVVYRVDFQVFYEDGTVEYLDAKGKKTDLYILKKKQVEAIYKIQIKEITRKDL